MAMLAMSAALAAEVYRWVDANGVTQYGSTPPPGARATRVDVPPSPAPAPTTASRPAAPSAGGAGPMSAPRAASDAEPLATRLQRCAEAREQLDVLTQPMRVFRFDAAGERVYLPDEARAVEVGHLRDAVAARCAGLDSDAATRERRRQMLSFLQCRRATDQLRFLEQPSTRAGRQEVEEARHAVRNFCEGSRFPADTGTRGEYFNAPIARSGR
jgi:hypothetical protein